MSLQPIVWIIIGIAFLASNLPWLTEKKSMGNIHLQEWEFFAIGVCLFTVFALPGFVYRHDLLRFSKKR